MRREELRGEEMSREELRRKKRMGATGKDGCGHPIRKSSGLNYFSNKDNLLQSSSELLSQLLEKHSRKCQLKVS